MQPRDYNYKNFRPLDVICTTAKGILGSGIRLNTAKLKGRNGFREFKYKNATIANHCAIVVKMGERFWLAEMVPDGLKINSMRRYLNNPKERIVAVRRHYCMQDEAVNKKGNDILLDLAHNMRDYDYKMVREYIGRGDDDPGKFYCSELCEHVANRCGFTWDQWNLKTEREGKTLIAPVEVQLGNDPNAFNVRDIYVY